MTPSPHIEYTLHYRYALAQASCGLLCLCGLAPAVLSVKWIPFTPSDKLEGALNAAACATALIGLFHLKEAFHACIKSHEIPPRPVFLTNR